MTTKRKTTLKKKIKAKKNGYKVVGIFKFPNGSTKRRTAYVLNKSEEELLAQSWSMDSEMMGGWLEDILTDKK